MLGRLKLRVQQRLVLLDLALPLLELLQLNGRLTRADPLKNFEILLLELPALELSLFRLDAVHGEARSLKVLGLGDCGVTGRMEHLCQLLGVPDAWLPLEGPLPIDDGLDLFEEVSIVFLDGSVALTLQPLGLAVGLEPQVVLLEVLDHA